MIHYHGLPITSAGALACLEVIKGAHAFVSFKSHGQLDLAVEHCQSFAIDNGAFSFWKSGKPKKDWDDFYTFVDENKNVPNLDFVVVPDIIDGGEEDNNSLLKDFPFKNIGAPVWHMHESVDRLVMLANTYQRICLGSSGEYSKVGTKEWVGRIKNTLPHILDEKGMPICKLHGLRMLNPKVFTQIPLSSADSTNIARNIGIDVNWKGTKLPPTKLCRAIVMKHRIEVYNSPTSFNNFNDVFDSYEESDDE